MLKAQNKAFKIESIPTPTPLLAYGQAGALLPLDSWFIRTTALRERMIELTRRSDGNPNRPGTGRFGKWLEGLVDWNLSR